MSRSSTAVTVWVDNDAYLSQRQLERQDGTSWRALSWFSEDHRELVSIYLTVDQAQDLWETLSTATLTVEGD